MTAKDGPFRELMKMKEEGLASAVGLAAGRVDIMTPIIRDWDFDAIITHNRFTLLNRNAEPMIDLAVSRGMAVFNAAPFAGGIFAKGSVEMPKLAYSPLREADLKRVHQVEAICTRHKVPAGAVALQFSIRDPRIASTICGVTKPERVAQTVAWANHPIPEAVWQDLKAIAPGYVRPRGPSRLHIGLMRMDPAASATVDPTEIDRFRRLADDWWDPKGRMRPLHEIAPTRLSHIRAEACAHFGRDPKAMRPLTGLTALDIGCAVGLVSEPMARMGARVTGIDPGAELIAAAKAHAASSGLSIDYRNALTDDLVKAEETFNLVLCLEVVEHVPDVPAFLATAAKLVAPGGLMILSTINRTLKSLLLAKIGAEYVLRWLPEGTHDWQRFVTPTELDAALLSAGLSVSGERGMIFNPLARGWQLARDTDVNYFMSATRST